MEIYSAPLQGFTEAPWRNAHEKFYDGINAYFTPFIRLENDKDNNLSIRNKDLRDIDPNNNTVSCLVPQITASKAEEFCILTDILAEKGYKWVDINMGCSFPMIVKRHKGCGIMPYPEEVEEIMLQIEKYHDIQFSVKMRLGSENCNEWKEIIPILNETRLKMITLHPRIGKQQYKGNVDMENFEAFMQECKHDIVYNGDITTSHEIKNIADKYPTIKGVMIGRGLLAKPWLAEEFFNGINMNNEEHYERIMQMHWELYAYYEKKLQGDSQLLNKMKCFWEYMEPTIGRKKYKEIKKCVNLNKYKFVIR